MGILSALMGQPSTSSMIGQAAGAGPTNPLLELLSGVKFGVQSGPFSVGVQGEDPTQKLIREMMLRNMGGAGMGGAGMGGAGMGGMAAGAAGAAGGGGPCPGGKCSVPPSTNSITTNPEVHSGGPVKPSTYRMAGGQLLSVPNKAYSYPSLGAPSIMKPFGAY